MQAGPPAYIDVQPPRSARLMFKAAALVDDVPTSIYDGVTQYPVGCTVFQEAQDDHEGDVQWCGSTAPVTGSIPNCL